MPDTDTDTADRLIDRLEREQRDVLARISALETLVATYDTLLDAIIEIREEDG